MANCKICFNSYQERSLHYLFNESTHICPKCLANLKPKFIEFSLDEIKGVAIYEYNEEIKKLIYQFKGCEDYELKDVFLSPFVNDLRLFYKGYLLVPAPSFIDEDNPKKFAHVEEIFKVLNLEIVSLFKKTSNVKQASLHFNERQKIGDNIELISELELRNKKILLIDDVSTTGATLKAMINLLKKRGFKECKILVIAKRILHGSD